MDLEFGSKRRKPDIRYLFDMKDVIFDRNWLEAADNIELYYMYRDLFLSRSDEK
ncbi:MAG: glucose-6-phosphate isomerase, partial [Methanothrix sp.]|nr:glucose-6-phosphate isomerase [Methanothrix sp.]